VVAAERSDTTSSRPLAPPPQAQQITRRKTGIEGHGLLSTTTTTKMKINSSSFYANVK